MTEWKFSYLFTPATWGGAFLGGIGAISVTEWLAVGGFILALLGFLVNAWHKVSMVKIERQRVLNESRKLAE